MTKHHPQRSSPTSLVELLCQRALHQPDQRAYTFLIDGETREQNLTYAELDRQARAIGALLQRSGATSKRALLLYPPGLEYIAALFGCFYAGVVAVPAYPPDLARANRTLPRLSAIIKDARPLIALTTTPILSLVEAMSAQHPDLQGLRWLATDMDVNDYKALWQPPTTTDDSIVLLQYTSGSTAAPKGVMISSGNLLHNSALIQRCFNHTEASRGVIWLPPYHDMGLVGGILQPLYAGFPVTLMSPLTFLQRPLCWLQAISHYRATTSGGPNFAYDLCVRKSTPEQRESLDLSSWEVAFNGAEPVRSETLERFAAAFAPCGFRRAALLPCYGLAEATLIVSGKAAGEQPVVRTIERAALEHHHVVEVAADGDAQRLVGCGQPLEEQQVILAHPESLTLCPPDQIGEIWVAGPSVAQGYWNRAAESVDSFRAQLADVPGTLFLRTGDLGFLREGQLFITGRLKDLIIIRGRNYYPQDIELLAEHSHPMLRPGGGAAFAVEIDGVERLVIVHEAGRQTEALDLDPVAGAIRQAVAEQLELHVYAVILVKAGSIPKTSSGKIQRHACKAAFLAGRLEVVGSSFLDDLALNGAWDTSAPAGGQDQLALAELLAAPPALRQSRLEAYLGVQVAHMLGQPAAGLDPRASLNALGLDSLMAVELNHAIEAAFGVLVPLSSLLQGPTLAQLAAQVSDQITGQAGLSPFVAHRPAADGTYALSYGQQRMWFIYQLAPQSAAYNIVGTLRILGDVQIAALQQAFQTLVDRHAMLRTTFEARQGEPLQRTHEHLAFSLHVEDATAWSAAALHERLAAEAQRPFDLERGPLLRVQLLTRAAHEHVLQLVMHHIVADFWSLAVLVHELGALYRAEISQTPTQLAPVAVQYADYVHWQASMLEGLRGEQFGAYWLERLSGEMAALNLPTDRPRPAVQTYEGASETFELSPELTQQLQSFSQAHATTLYTTLLAAFYVLLYHYTGQRDICIGVPMAGRSRTELAGLVGYLINPVPLRADLSGNPPFEQFLDQVRAHLLAALEYQDYPLGLLVERLQQARDPGRSPLFQVAFNFYHPHLFDAHDIPAIALRRTGVRLDMGGLVAEVMTVENRSSQLDLILMMGLSTGQLVGVLEYNSDLFDAATITRMAQCFRALLESILIAPASRIGALSLLPPHERQRGLPADRPTIRPTNPFVAFTRAELDQTIHARFEHQVQRHGERTAIKTQRHTWTYNRLGQESDRIARAVRSRRQHRHTRIALLLEHDAPMIAAMLGVLRSGNIYVPLEPSHPRQRTAMILADSQTELILTDNTHLDLATELASDAIPLLNIDAPAPDISLDDDPLQLQPASPDDLAYILYTSGSTGRPKGVMQSHRNVLHFIRNYTNNLHICPADRLSMLPSFNVAAAVMDMYGALLNGATLYPFNIKEAGFARLADWLREQEITIYHSSASVFRHFASTLTDTEQFPKLRLIDLGGEASYKKDIDMYKRHFAPECLFVNGLGTTEATVALQYFVNKHTEMSGNAVPVGYPVEDTEVVLLNEAGDPSITGVGEIAIKSRYVALGYWNDPAQTQAIFLPDPAGSAERIYRTGDLGRINAHGAIEYLGRRDFQVKIRGYRVEVSEIETYLLDVPAIKEAVVMAWDTDGDTTLCAYIVWKAAGGELAQASLTDRELREVLAQGLPDYMIPATFMTLEQMPVTPSGKIDRKQLLKPAEQPSQGAGSFVAPRNQLEEVVAGVWAEVLRKERVGIHDNFFELGGHSLLALQVVARLRNIFQVSLPLQHAFEAPTVSGLARVIQDALTAKIAALSESEVDQLLDRVSKAGSLK